MLNSETPVPQGFDDFRRPETFVHSSEVPVLQWLSIGRIMLEHYSPRMLQPCQGAEDEKLLEKNELLFQHETPIISMH
jgi:hypothetical protein